MKKLVFAIVMFLSFSVFGATNAVKDWVVNPNKECPVLKITWAAPTDLETFTFDFGGVVLRVVVNVTTVDADGDIVLEDISDANYIDWSDKLGSGSIDYVVKSSDVDGNAYGGMPVSGDHVGTLTDCAGAGAITMYIYFGK